MTRISIVVDHGTPNIRTTIRNRAIRIADLTVVSDIIQGVRFENCNIIGPAVLALLHNTGLEDSSIEGPAESLIWDLGDRVHVLGAVGLVDCHIIGCRLERIGFAVPPQNRAMFIEGFKLAPEGAIPHAQTPRGQSPKA